MLNHRENTLKKLASISVIVALALFVSACAAPAQPARVTNTAVVPITGTGADGAGSVTGNFVIDQFAEREGSIYAVGNFTGSVTNAAGEVTEGTQELTMLVGATTSPTAAAIDCPILHLDLGPLNLDLLGLVVDLDRVILDIVAQSGAGNLLGNLLCAVTGLLDGAGTITQIIGLLNQILALLPRA